jgi:putative ABC transport system permease protein
VRRLSSLAWRSLRDRILRSFLTSAGIALGVAVLFASLSAGATMDAAVNKAASDEMGSAALRVQALEERGLSSATVAVIEKASAVSVAAPALERKTFLATSVNQSPSAALPAPVTVLGIDPVAEPQLHPMPLTSGRLLSATDTNSAVVTQTLAEDQGLAVGGSVTFNGGAAGPQAYQIVGIVAGDGSVPDAAGRLVYLPLTTAQTLFATTGVTRVDLGTRPGISADELMGQLEVSIATEPYLLSRTSDLADSLRTETAGLAGTLLLVAAVVLFAGAFLIFNTMAMTVTERTREVGLLRAAGTTRSQVVGFVMLQAFALGVAGAVAGVVAGLGLAVLTSSWVGSAGPVTLSAPDLSIASVLLAFVIGVGVTIAAALEPAWRASRIPPVEALRRGPMGAAAGAARLRWLVLVFGVLALAALAIWPRGGEASAGGVLGGEATGLLGPLLVYAVLLVAVLLMPFVLRPAMWVAGIPFRIFRNEERLARSSLARDRSRTALTAGALVVGLAMVVGLGTAAQNVRQIGASWLAETIPGSELLTSIRPLPADDPVMAELVAMPGVKSVSPIGLFGVPLGGAQPVRQEAAAIIGKDFLDDGRLVFVAGGGDRTAALTALDSGGSVIVPQSLAQASDIHLGDMLSFGTGATPTQLKVVGIVAHSIPSGSEEAILIGWPDALGPFGATGADFYAVRYQPGQETAARAAVDAAAIGYALQPANLDKISGNVGDALDRIFRLLDALALIAVLVAGLGMVNTFSMSVLERVREIGVLRATGMTSRQVWGMVVIEAGILGIVGAVVGAVVGLAIGVLLVLLSSGGFGVSLDPPWVSIALAILFGFLVSVTASIYPAGRASRISIVRSLQHE